MQHWNSIVAGAAVAIACTVPCSASVSLLTTVQQTVFGQTILRVDGDSGLAEPTGDPPASTWANAYLYSQDAISYAGPRADENDPYEIWIKGDTTDPYLPNQRADSSPDFTADDGSFSNPIGDVSGSWDECCAIISFTPWSGTGAGTSLTIASTIPAAKMLNPSGL